METLLDGVNHIALLTRDMERFIRFYQEVFDAKVVHDNRHHAGHVGERMVIMALGGQSAFNVFEVPGNTQAQIQTPMFGRGRLDHFGLNARSRKTFEQARTRLMHRPPTDDSGDRCQAVLMASRGRTRRSIAQDLGVHRTTVRLVAQALSRTRFGGLTDPLGTWITGFGFPRCWGRRSRSG